MSFVRAKLKALLLVAASTVCLACGGPGSQVPQEVLATRGCHDGNPFNCKVLVAEKAPQPYREAGGNRESEAWCLVFQAGNLPAKSSLAYLARTTDGEAWLPEFGGKAKFKELGCVEAAQLAPEP